MPVVCLPVPESRGRRECAGTRSWPPHRSAPLRHDRRTAPPRPPHCSATTAHRS